MPTIYGYARVLSTTQNLESQLQALNDAGVQQSNIYTDKATGKNINKKAYKSL